jgi:serine O-acetyltransferase
MTAQFRQGRAQQVWPNLDQVVADLRDLRAQSHRTRYGDGVPPALPSRAMVITIIDGLAGAMFPRHFGPTGLTGDSFDAFVTVTLNDTLRLLQRQVRLELELAAHGHQGSSADQSARATEITGAFADGLAAIRALLETDIRAAYEGDPAATSLDEVMCCYPGVAAIIRHRLAHGLYRLGAPMLARIISEVANSSTGIDIHPGAQIGESFFIDHGTGVVIGETAIIGARVRLYQGVTLGARRFEVDEHGALLKNYPRHPIIEDDVVIYAGATVLGRITVGGGSTIAGSVWLTASVPPGSVITQAKVRNEGFDDGGGI